MEQETDSFKSKVYDLKKEHQYELNRLKAVHNKKMVHLIVRLKRLRKDIP